MASFDKAIPSGGEGMITLSVNTRGFQGKIYKTARVVTNDPDMKNITIGLRAVVKTPIQISPSYLRLFAREDQALSRVVEVRAVLEKPLSLEPVRFTLEGKMNYQIEEIEKGRFFKVYFQATEGLSGAFSGYLQFKTNYPEKPVIRITISGRIVSKTEEGVSPSPG